VIRVAAVSDVHAPEHLGLYERALSTMPQCDILLFAGDVILKGDAKQLARVVELTRRAHRGEIIACFGNEEYDQVWDELKSEPEIRWLDDEAVELSVGGKRVAVVGSRGALDRPTFWQRTHVPGIRQTYWKRVRLIDELLGSLRADVKIVLTHYSPTYATLEGERERLWPEMGCRKMEQVIQKHQPDLWIHGHAHNSKRLEAKFGRTLVANVSLPARKEIAVFELPRRVGLEAFV
jgi:Icc-related predicted phosphoesterase